MNSRENRILNWMRLNPNWAWLKTLENPLRVSVIAGHVSATEQELNQAYAVVFRAKRISRSKSMDNYNHTECWSDNDERGDTVWADNGVKCMHSEAS